MNSKTDRGFSKTQKVAPDGSSANEISHGIPNKLGQYRLVREIGHGGMGLVFEAVDEPFSQQRRVAVKVLPRASLMEPKRVRRFENEALAAATLNHDHIVRVLNRGVESGIHYFAMDYIEGTDLGKTITSLRKSRSLRRQSTRRTAGTDPTVSLNSDKSPPVDVPQGSTGEENLAVDSSIAELIGVVDNSSGPSSVEPFRPACHLIIQAADALQHAHDLGIVHRDVKPSNLLLDHHGKLFVTDFGLAQMRGTPGVTMAGDLIGTLRYMSPEQTHANHVVIDHRTDIYSLGITLYELVTLEHAVKGKTTEEVFQAISFREPTSARKINRRIPYDLETIINKAINKNPVDRYETMGELADDLRQFIDDNPIRARRPTPVEQLSRWSRKNTRTVVSLIGGLLIAVVVSLLFLSMVTENLAQEREFSAELKAALLKSEGNRAAAITENLVRENPGLAMATAAWGLERHEGLRTRIAATKALEANHELKTLRHEAPVNQTLFHPSEDYVVTVEVYERQRPEQSLRIWEVATGQLHATVTRQGHSIVSALLSADGKHLVTASKSDSEPNVLIDSVAVWEFDKPTKPTVLRNSSIAKLKEGCMSENGEQTEIIVPCADNRVSIFDMSGVLVKSLNGHTDVVTEAIMDRSRNLAVAAGDAGEMLVWKIDDPARELQPSQQISLGVPHNLARRLMFGIGDGDVIASWPKGMRIWNAMTGLAVFDKEWSLGDTFVDYERKEFVLFRTAAVFERYDAVSGRELKSINSVAGEKTTNVDGSLIANIAGGPTHVIQVIDGFNGRPLAALKGHEGYINDVGFSQSSEFLVSGSSDRTARIWRRKSYVDLTTQQERAFQLGDSRCAIGEDTILTPVRMPIETVIETDAGREIVFPGRVVAKQKQVGKQVILQNGDTLSVIETQTGNLIAKRTFGFEIHSTGDRGEHVVLLDGDGSLWIWHLRTNKLARFQFEKMSASGLAMNPTSAQVAMSGNDSRVVFWEPEGEPRQWRSTAPVNRLVYAPSGDLWIHTQDGRLTILDSESLEVKRETELKLSPRSNIYVGAREEYILAKSGPIPGMPVPNKSWQCRLSAFRLIDGELIGETKVAFEVQIAAHKTLPIVIYADQSRALMKWNYVDDQIQNLHEGPVQDFALDNMLTASIAVPLIGARSYVSGASHLPNDTNPRIMRWDLSEQEPVEQKASQTIAAEQVFSQSDGQVVYSGRAFQVKTTVGPEFDTLNAPLRSPTAFIHLAYLEATQTVVSCSVSGELLYWKKEAGVKTLAKPGSSAVVHAVQSADDQILIVIDKAGNCRSYDLQQMKHISSITLPKQNPYDVRVSENGSRVLIAFKDRLFFWNPHSNEAPAEQPIDSQFARVSPEVAGYLVIDNEKKLRVFSAVGASPHELEGVAKAIYSPDRKHVFAIADDRIKMVEISSGQIVRELRPYIGSLQNLSFASAEYLVAVADSTIAVYATSNWERTHEFQNQDRSFAKQWQFGNTAPITSDGQWLFWGESNGYVRRFNLQPMNQLKLQVPETLAQRERERYQMPVKLPFE